VRARAPKVIGNQPTDFRPFYVPPWFVGVFQTWLVPIYTDFPSDKRQKVSWRISNSDADFKPSELSAIDEGHCSIYRGVAREEPWQVASADLRERHVQHGGGGGHDAGAAVRRATSEGRHVEQGEKGKVVPRIG
jgi:hypothetical protein